MKSLNEFISGYPDLINKPKSLQVDLFAYYLITEKKLVTFTAKDIDACFNELRMQSYSNIPSYFTRNKKGKDAKYIYSKNGYSLNRVYYLKLKEEIENTEYLKEPSNEIFPIELFNNTRGYLVKIAKQTALCYDYKLFDASAVMLRKLMETLIIEAFEKYKDADSIKDDDGNFYYLSSLIQLLLASNNWTISRNARKGFIKIKELGDLSAHNRRYWATKQDLESRIESIRICIQELVNLIDYQNWKP